MKKILFLIVIFLLESCYSSDEINNNTTFSDIFIKTQKFADDFNSKKIKADDSLPNIYKIEKKYFIEKYNAYNAGYNEKEAIVSLQTL